MSDVRNLEPKALWNAFADLNAIPRASKKEAAVLQHLKDFAAKHGLACSQDEAGNILMAKPASAGMENRPTVVMQAHVDMVHQKNRDVAFDFDAQGIDMWVDGDWVRARGTTLGADNGLGAAAILAIMEDKTLRHPRLEGLFTVDEEAGMTGAKNLQEKWLTGKILLNLDTEEDDEFTIGCAGGVDTFTTLRYAEEALPAGYEVLEIHLRGLVGGHSGMDIHRGFGNANQLLARALLAGGSNVHLISFDGGSLRNAIPREASAVVAVPSRATFEAGFLLEAGINKGEYATTDPQLNFSVASFSGATKAASAKDSVAILMALHACPNGADRWSPDMEDLVETSSNLARVIMAGGQFETQSLQRSSLNTARDDMAHRVAAVFKLLGATARHTGEYPGWAPNPHSPLVDRMAALYEEMNGQKPKVMACHAGLECGIIGEHYPGMDMVSFGPTIRGAHSPDERASIASAQKFWSFLLRVLETFPAA